MLFAAGTVLEAVHSGRSRLQQAAGKPVRRPRLSEGIAEEMERVTVELTPPGAKQMISLCQVH